MRVGLSRADACIIVFDGVCTLCSGWVRFLLRHDRLARYRFAAMQTPAGRRLLRENGLDADDPVSFLLLEGDSARTDSDAIIAVLTGLGGAWRLAGLARLVPGALRDPAYRWLARNRYRWFGRSDVCLVPDTPMRGRFIEGE
jgi:predicted DCC family thiol-disulfide oxidoreductase YuxK